MEDNVPKSSNIINDSVMCQRFFKEALKVTNSLKYRYFSVFEQMTAEDVVMECFVKILKGNISFDESKKCKFETFVRLIVTSQLTDELKRLSASKRSGICLSLDSEVPGMDNDEESSTLYNTIGDTRSQYYFEYSEIQKDLYDIDKELRVCEGITESVLRLCEDGYSVSDISEICHIDRGSIKQKLQDIRSIYFNRCEGTSMLISEILYGDDDTLDKWKSHLLLVSSHIIDEITGVKLSDIIKLVIKDYSYKGIGEKLNISESDVRRFLTECEGVRI